MIILLDSGVLSILASPLKDNISDPDSELEDNRVYQCYQWCEKLSAKSIYIVTSEISDYEVRRELIRINSKGLELLDSLRDTKTIDFLPITTEVIKIAAEFWADTRKRGISTSDDKNIDADMIISAQWKILTQEYPGRSVLIATTNVKHLKIFAQDSAQEWENIRV